MVRITGLSFLLLLFLLGGYATAQNIQINTISPRPTNLASDIPPAMATTGVDGCVKCHENQEDLALNQPVLDWMLSVHATKGQSCNGCHGGNPDLYDEEKSKDPAFGFIGKPTNEEITDFCGRGGCHAEELSEFKKGPHYQAVIETGLPSCITCHGVHNIKRSTMEIIDNRNCSICHPQEYSAEVLRTMKIIEYDIATVSQNIEYLKSKKASVDDLSERLVRTQKLYASYVHIFSQDKVSQTETIIKLSLENLLRESQSFRALSQRLDILYYAMLILGLVITIVLALFFIITLAGRQRMRPGL